MAICFCQLWLWPCSAWGRNRVLTHSQPQPLSLVFPALTDPLIVQQAVAGVLKGHIRLSSSNIEAVLVLANAVGVSHLLVVMNTHLLKMYTCSHVLSQIVYRRSQFVE